MSIDQDEFEQLKKNPEKLTEELALEAICTKGEWIKDILKIDRFENIDFCDKAVTKKPQVIKFIPENLITKEMCEKALEWGHHAFSFIPNKFKTLEMCKKVDSLSSQYINAIPDNLLVAFFNSFSGVEKEDKIKYWEEKTKRKYDPETLAGLENVSATEDDEIELADAGKSETESKSEKGGWIDAELGDGSKTDVSEVSFAENEVSSDEKTAENTERVEGLSTDEIERLRRKMEGTRLVVDDLVRLCEYIEKTDADNFKIWIDAIRNLEKQYPEGMKILSMEMVSKDAGALLEQFMNVVMEMDGKDLDTKRVRDKISGVKEGMEKNMAEGVQRPEDKEQVEEKDGEKSGVQESGAMEADARDPETVRLLYDASRLNGRVKEIVAMFRNAGDKYKNLRLALVDNIEDLEDLEASVKTLEGRDEQFEKRVRQTHERRVALLEDPLIKEFEGESQSGRAEESVTVEDTSQTVPEEIKEAVQETRDILDKDGVDLGGLTVLGRIPERSRTSGVCLAMVREDGLCLQDVPAVVLDGDDGDKIRKCAVAQNGMALEFIAEDRRTSEICAIAIRQNGKALKFLGDECEFRSPDLYLEAVRQNGLALQYVREAEKTPELCLAAYRNNQEAIDFIPENLREHVRDVADSADREMKTIESLKDGSLCLADVRRRDQTYVVCMTAVEYDPMQLEHVLPGFVTPELCLVAVRKNGRALQYVPEDMRNSIICDAALTENNDAWIWVPEKLRDKELYRKIVKNDCWNLQYVPDEFKSQEMCEEAVERNGLVLQFVGARWMTSYICVLALHSNGEARKYLPKNKDMKDILKEAVNQKGKALAVIEEKTAELCGLAVRRDGLALQYVSEEMLTEEIALQAVGQNGQALRFVPEALRTENVCQEALKNRADALQYIPENIKTNEACLSAVSRNGIMLRFVPMKLRTPEICISAVTNNALAREYVPDNLLHYVDCFYTMNGGPLKLMEKDSSDVKSDDEKQKEESVNDPDIWHGQSEKENPEEKSDAA